ncbi:potassium voltage-gated channel protein Shaw-like [Ylistrum balloti]|uniref:potassium voltage-gated channel protein Shaw-like n=1 Tax=Ylistrum balloti TaxID=509963 RepID=UPI002905BA74|nr:potassium voltage-gated channel protein Shaw-like [Ylistrum balloti]
MEFIKRDRETSKSKKSDKRVKLNIGGEVFESWISTLERIPGTRLALLAHLQEADESWDKERDEFFFDRHAGAFISILHYYRTEELHVDQNICGNIIRGELDFWGLTELDIEPCCWGHYSKFKDHKETLAALDDNFTTEMDIDAWGDKPTNLNRFKRQMWQFMEEPGSTRGAKIFAFISMSFVVLSIGIFTMETYTWFRVPITGAVKKNSSAMSLTLNTVGDYCVKTGGGEDVYSFADTKPHLVMQILDYVCAAYFTAEYVFRLFFAPRKFEFLRQPLNVIDILCLIPHLIAIILVTIDPNDSTSQLFKSMLALRTVRILRIFKLMKHYSAFNILVYTIKVSTKELLLMVIFLFTGVLIFASVIFYVESDTFENIPIGFWWALVTMTTVGYGDKVPKTVGGYIIGCGCVLCGVLTVAFTVPIVVNNFTLYYSHAQSRIKLPAHKRKELKRKIFIKNQKSSNFLDKLRKKKKNKDSHFSEIDAIEIKRSPPCGEEAGKLNSTNIDLSASRQTSHLVHENNKETDSSRQERIHTISEKMDDGSATSITPVEIDVIENEQHKIETTQLLNGLKETNQRMKEERRRQLEVLRTKREQKMLQKEGGKTPRAAPAPAASSRRRTDNR